MATTQDDIREWLAEGKAQNSRYILIACDTFDYSDYPLFFKFIENLKDRFQHPHSMESFMECYDLSLDWESQLNEPRSWHPSKDELKQ